MAGLEVVVRPVVLPNIRPTSPRMLLRAAASGNEETTIGGGGGHLIDLPRSYHSSSQRQLPHREEQRVFDVDRISQKNEDGTINKDNFVDVERMTALRAIGGAEKAGVSQRLEIMFAAPPETDNIKIIESGKVRYAEKGEE